MEIFPIAHIRSDFSEKFGIPRQSGLADNLQARIVFEPDYRNPNALKGLEDFSHLWMIWEFSANRTSAVWQPMVRPPRLGGNKYMGVFATRSPFRPNSLGLSCVQIESIELDTPDGPVINVRGADLLDGTPIYDIKPYIKYADSRPHASCGYVDALSGETLQVHFPDHLVDKIIIKSKVSALIQVLKLDPRPSYHDDPERVYGLSFAGQNIRFKVDGRQLTVTDVE